MNAFKGMSYGPIGEAVQAAMPYTEADPIGVYAAVLSQFSSAISRTTTTDKGRPVVVWTVLAGLSAYGRKGYALGTSQQILASGVGKYLKARTKSGIASGPALVDHLFALELETMGTETGVDGRAMIIEEEWATVLKRAKKCATFSPLLRTAWDGKAVSNHTKEGVQEVTRPLVGFHAHITPGEWAKYVSASEALGGSFNRILPVKTEKSQRLPYTADTTAPIAWRLGEAYRWACSEQRVMELTKGAADRFDELRDEIEGRLLRLPESISCFMERSEEQVIRVASVLTAAEMKTKVSKRALEAAWAFVQYSMASTEQLVREAATATGARVVKTLEESIIDVLTRLGGTATSTQILRALGSRANAAGLKTAVERMDRVESWTEKTGGRGAPTTHYLLLDEEQAEKKAAAQQRAGEEKADLHVVAAKPKRRTSARKKPVAEREQPQLELEVVA
ncbi:hypothetical protein IPZ58_05245 [Streptomyces roseoverticillatus]|uniref:DUF3987 domain-containing protein n=1 Tax=Streptomyces roseoverticillatus TaxID=66429 RepID=UPI001F3A97A6|nr:DUF3987 domain-containing protein [Streptomyces roseoverticillatus]MCF3100980.1 hypothetical protein [Streptomyces roseoverticillatus]